MLLNKSDNSLVMFFLSIFTYVLSCLCKVFISISCLKFVLNNRNPYLLQILFFLNCSIWCKDRKKFVTVNLFPNKPWFLCVCSTSLLKTVREKEKLLITSNFSFFHSVFHPFGEFSAIFIKYKIVVCKLFQFGRV